MATRTGYPSPSEARAALAWKACFYTDDAAQIARIVRNSGLFKAGLSDRERDRKADKDATQAVSTYSGERYTPGRQRQAGRLIMPAAGDVDDAPPANLTTAEMWAMLKAEHAARLEAEERARRLSLERSHMMAILRNGDLSTGERLTGFALALDMQARIANGEEPQPGGLKAPAVRYAEMTGQSEGTAAKHLRNLADKGLITKRIVREQTEYEDPDLETGEILTARGLRDVNYIEVPGGNVINLIDRLATYQRPDDEGRHGGKREPRPVCRHHPEAGTYTIRHEHIECAQCHATLETSEPKRTYHPPMDDDELEECSGSKLIAELSTAPPVVNPLLSDSKMTPEPAAQMDTDSIMPPESLGDAWIDERRRLYGELVP